MTSIQCDCMNTVINCPASPVGIGPIGKNGCNPFAPKNAKINPNNTRAIITAIFIASPLPEVQDVFFDAQTGHSGAGIKSRSDIDFEGKPSPTASTCSRAFMPLLRLTEYRHPSKQFHFRPTSRCSSNARKWHFGGRSFSSDIQSLAQKGLSPLKKWLLLFISTSR
jgi:hypothetical protein